MNAFDKVIGYEAIKEELLQICDMIKNREVYEKIGAKFPQGILMYGNPGLGKTLMAKAFIKESGLETFTVRRNKGSNDFIGEITNTFAKAKEKAPSIVFLDDMDKFANEDSNHRDAEEYVAVQAGIDEVKGSGVLVIATVNEAWKLPLSLRRAGRFDRKIEFDCPTEKDAERIIEYYLSDKPIAEDVCMDDLCKMINYSSCAELETMLNEAAISAAFARKEKVEMADLIKSVLRMQYESPENYTKMSDENLKKTALHESGHIVAAEVLHKGSVGLASIRSSAMGDAGGFIHLCKVSQRDADSIIIALASKAAVELYYCEDYASGCEADIRRVFNVIREAVSDKGSKGLSMIDVSTESFPRTSEAYKDRNEAVVHAEMERYMLKTKDLLLKNRDFLEKVAKALEEKETLLYSDIQKLRQEVEITEVAV